MKKPTVEQKYTEQQMANQGNIPKQAAQQALETPEQKEANSIINNLKQSLQQTQQAIRQAQVSFPVNPQLSKADQMLSHSTQLIKQLETIKLSVSNGTKQQLKQLHYQVEAAAGTLSMIEQAIGKNS